MRQLKPLILDTRRSIQRSSGILFLFLLFGALGAGFFFVVQQVLGVEHILGALEPANEPILWFILFWATDFFFIAMCALLCYFIAGWPGLAPGLALPIYFAHFAGQPVAAQDAYFTFFATPLNQGGGVNIGWISYFLMALFCALLIRLLYAGWHWLKEKAGPKAEKILEQADLIILVLLIPVASAALTFVLVRYGLQKPFGGFGAAVLEPLLELSGQHIVITGLLFGLMVGFDITGPVSMAAFGVAAAAFMQGDARLLTIYGACFVTVGWSPTFMLILSKVLKRVTTDADDINLAVSGPINAFFENMKLTVAFSMPFAMRSPFAVIPGLMAGSAVTGGLAALFGIVNDAYLNLPPKFGHLSMAELLERGEIYLSFTLPLRSGDWWAVRIPLAIFILVGGAVGGAVMYFLRAALVKGQKRRGTYVEPGGDIVLEMRALAKERLAGLRKG